MGENDKLVEELKAALAHYRGIEKYMNEHGCKFPQQNINLNTYKWNIHGFAFAEAEQYSKFRAEQMMREQEQREQREQMMREQEHQKTAAPSTPRARSRSSSQSTTPAANCSLRAGKNFTVTINEKSQTFRVAQNMKSQAQKI